MGMGGFTLCNHMMSTCVSKNMLGFQSELGKSCRPISCTALPCVKISVVPKNLFKFGSGSATSHMLLSSSTTLPSVRISAVSKNLLGFESGPATTRMLLSSTALPSVKSSVVSENMFGLGFGQKLGNPVSHLVGTRHYCCAHKNQNFICKPLTKCLSFVTFFTGRVEMVPFTNITLYVFPFIDKIWGELYFRDVKEECKNGWILSQTHPQSVRIESIAIKILEALQRETGRCHMLADQQWVKENDSEAKLIKKGRRGDNVKSTSEHLKEGITWELFVVDVALVQAGYINIGKILVFRGLFDRFKTDEELAMIIAQQVGHVVSRHPQRRLTWFPFKLYHRFVTGYDPEMYYQLRHEHEADYLGMLLAASAGYDPRVAPTALGKMKRDFRGNDAKILLLER
ncbi:hypothetical protein POM88_009402 [Heracleum sosnowskyi]|uniref:Peptidase M48 domain-containing protein n=1 Tax=Heracleum sosnowskyi TaxID=360622 RepID=A0AAD8J9X2_9APIA|nr:hypothetical protein POM88_009402 [Heracleum sosnowskyi]